MNLQRFHVVPLNPIGRKTRQSARRKTHEARKRIKEQLNSHMTRSPGIEPKLKW
jgi:hypothetical protein